MNKRRVSLIVAFVIAVVLLMWSQTIQYVYQFKTIFTSAVPSSGVRVIGSGAAFHQLSWNNTGTVSTCSIRVDSSVDGVTWNAGDIIGATACTSNGTVTSVSFVANFVRINLTTLTGGGTVTANLYGYASNPAGGGGGTPGGVNGDIQFNNAGAFGGVTLVGLNHGGTNVDLSAAGGANNFLAISAGHVISAAQPAFSNLSGTIAQAQFPATTDLPAGGALRFNGSSSGTMSITPSSTGNSLTLATAGTATITDTSGLTLQGASSSQLSLANPVALSTTSTLDFNSTANGYKYQFGIVNAEALTLNTGSTTTDTVANLLPANAIIDAITYRITTTITTAASFTIGDATTAARFCGTQSTLTAGTTGICYQQMQGSVASDAAGPVQTTAAKLRVTTNANPGAGAIRLVVFYRTITPPTS